jgi:predicted DNA-binding transcriptional regulator YafY
MYSPTTRVLTVLELLQTHGRMSGAELAARLEVDVRTLRRYVARLDELGIPVTAERGRYGHYSLVAGFKLPPMMFADDEALALSVGLLAARQLGLAQAAPAVERAQAKLERVMPDPLKARLRALSETISLDLSRSTAATHDNATLLTLSMAAHSRQRVHLRYRTPQGEGLTESERDFDAYGLAWRGGRWYAVGHCHLRKELRSFRLDRIVDVTTRNLFFSPPATFDAVAYLAQSAATMPRAIRVVVLLRTDLNTARNELFESIGVFQPTDTGVLLTSQVDDLNWYARELARLPFAFAVQEPAALRRALIARAKVLTNLANK